MLNKHCGLIRDVIKRSLKSHIAERDCFYDDCSHSDGTVDDPHDIADLADMDNLIDDLQKVDRLINLRDV